MAKMRAKMHVCSVTGNETSQTIAMVAVCKANGYPADGSDEDNTFAKWTPSAHLNMTVNNPDLIGTIKVGDKFYVDFTPAP